MSRPEGPPQRGRLDPSGLLGKLRRWWRRDRRVAALERELAAAKKTQERLQREKDEAQGLAAKLLALSTQDSLTEIANRRRFDEFLDKEWRRSARAGAAVALILCDIDGFKPFNDRYGHQQGDDCLRRVARVIDDHAKRGGDLAARYGGDEFALILPDTNLRNALQLADRMRRAIEQLAIRHEAASAKGIVTASVGVAAMAPPRSLAPRALIAQADAALYQAKLSGGNQALARPAPDGRDSDGVSPPPAAGAG